MSVLIAEREGSYDSHVSDWLSEARAVVVENHEGRMALIYDIASDEMAYVFGHGKFPYLLDPSTGKPYLDDPLSFSRSDPTPTVKEFLVYLRDWYHPKQRKLRDAPCASS